MLHPSFSVGAAALLASALLASAADDAKPPAPVNGEWCHGWWQRAPRVWACPASYGIHSRVTHPARWADNATEYLSCQAAGCGWKVRAGVTRECGARKAVRPGRPPPAAACSVPPRAPAAGSSRVDAALRLPRDRLPAGQRVHCHLGGGQAAHLRGAHRHVVCPARLVCLLARVRMS